MVDKLDDASLRILKLPADFPREEVLNIFGKEIFNTNEVFRTHVHNDKYNAGRSLGYITFNDSNTIKRIFYDLDEFEHYFTYKSKQICVTVQKKPSARIDANNNEQTQSSTTLQEPSLKRARLDQNNRENTQNSPILHESNKSESTQSESTANVEILRLNNEILRLRAERLIESYSSMKSSVENFLNELRLNETKGKSNQS
jgi:hypothetical protein